MIQVSTFDEPVVHKKILIAPGLLRSFRLTHKTIDIHIIRPFLNRHHFGIVVIAQQLYHPLFKRSLIQVEDFLSVTGERKEDTRERHGHPYEFVHDMPELCGIAFQKIPPGRYVEKKILHGDPCARGCGNGFLFLNPAVLNFNIGARFIARFPGL